METLQSKIRISNKSRVAGENKFRILHGLPTGEFSDSSKFFGEGFSTFLRAQQCSMSVIVQKQNWWTIRWISCSWLWCKVQWKLPALMNRFAILGQVIHGRLPWITCPLEAREWVGYRGGKRVLLQSKSAKESISIHSQYISVYIIHKANRICGQYEKNISLIHCAHLWNIFQHLKRNFVSPCGHVISSIGQCFLMEFVWYLLGIISCTGHSQYISVYIIHKANRICGQYEVNREFW